VVVLVREWLSVFALALAVTVFAACGTAGEEGEPSTPTPAVAGDRVTPTPAVAGAVDAATPVPTPSPQRTPVPPCPGGPEASLELMDEVEARALEAMAGYNGSWGLALIDLDCETSMAINGDWAEYAASSSKIVVVIAVLRAVEDGRLDYESIRPQVEGVMHHSWDADATHLNYLVSPQEIQEVLDMAGMSDASEFPYVWNYAIMTAPDLARVWEALLRGELLGEEWTERLLDLASQAEVPPSNETFPAEFDEPGYQFGQKAGYYVTGGLPYYLVGAGYVRPEEPGERLGYVMVFTVYSLNPDLDEPQRRAVFPILMDYVRAASQ
jgi:hypothetical protein